jgi:selenocysteine lyase/cysteine desulfurase
VTSYLDHAGIGLVRPAARAAMHEAIDEVLATGSAGYARFFAARTAARQAAATLLDCDPDELALVPNTSTGLQLVADGLTWRPGDEVVVFDGDFPANVQPWRRLAEQGVRLRWVPASGDGWQTADLAAVLGPATRLVALSHVHFVTGYRMDLAAVCALAKQHKTLVCVDAVQSLGVVPLSLAETPVDFLAAGGHKWLGGPPGTGLFFCRANRLPLLAGAPLGWFGYQGSDEIFGRGGGFLRYDLPPRPAARRFEGGMLNFVGLVGLAAALDELTTVGPDKISARVGRLTGVLRAGLTALGLVASGTGDPAHRSGIVSFVPESGHWYEQLEARGCHCSYPDGRIRLAPHYWTEDREIDELLTVLGSVAGR